TPRAVGGALTGLVDLHDVLIDIVADRGLLFGGRRDLLALVDNLDYCPQDVVQRRLHLQGRVHRLTGHAVAYAHGLDRRPDAALQAPDHLFDFLGGLLGALCQGAYLIGYHGEAAPLLAGPGRLDRRVERQQVGLLGDALDHIQHPADRRAVIGQVINHLHRVLDLAGQLLDAIDRGLDHAPPGQGLAVDLLGVGHRQRGAAGDLLGGSRHFVHGCGHLLDLGPLPFHRLTALAGDVDDLAGLVAHQPGGLADMAHQALDTFDAAVEFPGQLAQFV